jgi:hypothetical protein
MIIENADKELEKEMLESMGSTVRVSARPRRAR